LTNIDLYSVRSSRFVTAELSKAGPVQQRSANPLDA